MIHFREKAFGAPSGAVSAENRSPLRRAIADSLIPVRYPFKTKGELADKPVMKLKLPVAGGDPGVSPYTPRSGWVMRSMGKSALATVCLTICVFSSVSAALAASPATGDAAKYFPLAPGNTWILKQAVGGAQFVYQVVSGNGTTNRLRITTPWGTSDCNLSLVADKYWMTGYGSASGLMPINNTLYFDFASPQGTSWSNILGPFSVSSRSAVVSASGVAFATTVQITQGTGPNASTLTFAAGVGPVSYTAGGQVFLLDTKASKLPASAAAVVSQVRWTSPTLPLVGVVPTSFANQVGTMQTSINQVQMLETAGARFLQAYGRWSDLEPTQGNYQIDSLSLQVAEAQAMNLSFGYTFCVIDMTNRNVPAELQNLPWSDPTLQARVLTMVDVLAQNFGSHIKYFQFGNEVDNYFQSHPNEISDFATLLNKVRAVVQNRAPGVKVSATLTFASLPSLASVLSPINHASDVLAITYGPYNADFSVEPPSVVSRDFQTMRLAASGRQVYLQEMAYPSATEVSSSQDLQAQFVQNVFTELRSTPSEFAAANFYDLADFSSDQAVAFGASVGFGGQAKFVSLAGSLGMFDVSANPKKSWQMFSQQALQ